MTCPTCGRHHELDEPCATKYGSVQDLIERDYLYWAAQCEWDDVYMPEMAGKTRHYMRQLAARLGIAVA